MLSDDQATIQRVLDGDLAAYTELVERYQRRLLGLLYHACGNQVEAEDLAQETFTRAYRKLKLYSGQSQFYTWLCRVAMNLLVSQKRRKRIENQMAREGMELAMDSAGVSSSVDADMERHETCQQVRQAISMLDAERRTVILLRDFDGMDYDAIAQTLDIPVGTVRSRLHRARLELKSILEKKMGQLGATPRN
jgi:RNA polymerase sigma-70 factor, ECF subfamily